MDERRERGLKRLPDGGWRWSYRDPNGKYHRNKAPNNTQARAFLEKARAEIREGRWLDRKERRKTTLEDAVKQFFEWGETNAASGTLRRDREFASLWLAFCKFQGKLISEITVQDVEAYRTLRRGGTKRRAMGKRTFQTRPAGKVTCDNDLSQLRRLFSLCIGWKLTTDNPAKGVKRFRPESKHDRFLTQDEEKAVLKVCADDVRSAVRFSIHSGIRQGSSSPSPGRS